MMPTARAPHRSLLAALGSIALLAVPSSPAATVAPVPAPAERLLAGVSVETGAAVLSGERRATLNGAITPQGGALTYSFEYGVTSAYGRATPAVELPPGTTRSAVRATVTGLSTGTTYHYRLIARSGDGTVTTGRDRTFSTSATTQPPAASTLVATDVGVDRVTLHARVNPGGQPTTFQFEWGPTAAYGSVTASATAGSGTSGAAVSTLVTGLRPSVAYHYRVIATNASGTRRGGDRVVRTSRGLTGISVLPSATTVAWNGTVMVNGAVAGAAVDRAPVLLLRQDHPYTAAYRQAAVTTTDGMGRYSFRLGRIYASTRLKVQAGRSSPIVSPVVPIGSELFVRLQISRRRSATVRLTGRVYPAARRGRVRIEREHADGSWTLVRTARLRTLRSGRSTFGLTLKRLRRTARYRAVVDPSDGGAHVKTTTSVKVARRR